MKVGLSIFQHRNNPHQSERLPIPLAAPTPLVMTDPRLKYL